MCVLDCLCNSPPSCGPACAIALQGAASAAGLHGARLGLEVWTSLLWRSTLPCRPVRLCALQPAIASLCVGLLCAPSARQQSRSKEDHRARFLCI